MGWNWLDTALAGIVAISVIAAIWQGLIREIISLASVVAGLAVAVLEYSRAAIWLGRWIPSPDTAKAAAFLGLFFGIVIVGAVLAYLLRSVVQMVGLGWFDRFLGGVFGLVRGFVICSVVLLALVTFSISPAIVQNSALTPYVLLGARAVSATLPKDLSTQFHKGLESFRKALIEQDKKATAK